MKWIQTVLVTGTAGSSGSHVVDELIRRSSSVVALDDLSGGFRAQLLVAIALCALSYLALIKPVRQRGVL